MNACARCPFFSFSGFAEFLLLAGPLSGAQPHPDTRGPWPAAEPHYRGGLSATLSSPRLICDRFEGSCRAGLRIVFECAVAGNQFPAEGRDSCSPTATTPRRGDYDGYAKRSVEAPEQLPATAIAHAKVPGSLREGARAVNCLEECDLSRTHTTKCCEVHPETDGWLGHSACFPRHLSARQS
jgi:hypothetical protein